MTDLGQFEATPFSDRLPCASVSIQSVPHESRSGGLAAGVARQESPLVAGLRTGSFAAFRQLVTAHQPIVYAVAFRFTRNHHEAEDIVQETFVRAFQAGPRFRGDASVGTWLHVIATNIARNRYRYWRRRNGARIVSLDATPTDAGVAEAAQVTEPETARMGLEIGDDIDQLAAEMARLPRRDRDILRMCYFEHATYRQIASALGLALGTVKSRIARARARLRVLFVSRATER